MSGPRLRGIAALALVTAVAAAPVRADDSRIVDAAGLATTDGQVIYQQICQGCHMADARGAIGAGYYPALAGDRTLASKQYMALTLLAGRRNMPAFGARHAIPVFFMPAVTLSEEQIAAVINYVRTHFGNHYADPISAAEVRALDHTLK